MKVLSLTTSKTIIEVMPSVYQLWLYSLLFIPNFFFKACNYVTFEKKKKTPIHILSSYKWKAEFVSNKKHPCLILDTFTATASWPVAYGS